MNDRRLAVAGDANVTARRSSLLLPGALLLALTGCAAPGRSIPSPAPVPRALQGVMFVSLYERLCLRTTPREAVAEALRLGFGRSGFDERQGLFRREPAPENAVLVRPGPEVYLLILQTLPAPGRAAGRQACTLGTALGEQEVRDAFLALMGKLAGEGLAVEPRRLDLEGATPLSLVVSVTGPAARSRRAFLVPQRNPASMIRTNLMVLE